MSHKGKRDDGRDAYHNKSLCRSKGPDCAHLSASTARKAGLMQWSTSQEPGTARELHHLPLLKVATGN